jgi:hypothetical protein
MVCDSRAGPYSQEILMDPILKKSIVGASLFAFGAHTFDLAHEGITGHELPSALHFVQIAAGSGVAATSSSGTATVSAVFSSFGSATTEAIYPGVANSQVLKHDGQVQLPLPPKPGPKV